MATSLWLLIVAVMYEVLIFVTTSVVFSSYLAPRVFVFADRRVAKSRLHQTFQSSLHKNANDTPRIFDSEIDWPLFCDSLSRYTRRGMPAREALISALRDQSVHFTSFLTDLESTTSVAQCLVNAQHQLKNEDVSALELISHTLVQLHFVPQSLDYVSRTLRDIRQCAHESQLAATHASLSAKLLTVVPISAFVIGVLTSESVRTGLKSPLFLTFCVSAVVLNGFGWKWIKALIRRSLHNEMNDNVLQIADYLCVSLFSGSSISSAFLTMPLQSQLARNICLSMNNGDSLETALAPLFHNATSFAQNFASLMSSANTDGLPVLQAVHQLATEARIERRRESEALIRTLPTKLTLPLVLCILPSFLLGTLAPFLTLVFSQVQFPSSM